MKIAASLLLAVLGIGITWAVQGRHLMTMTQRLVVEKVVDEFGDAAEKVRWEPALRIGLLDVTLPAAGVLGGTAVFLLWRVRRARRRAIALREGSAPAAEPKQIGS